VATVAVWWRVANGAVGSDVVFGLRSSSEHSCRLENMISNIVVVVLTSNWFS